LNNNYVERVVTIYTNNKHHN